MESWIVNTLNYLAEMEFFNFHLYKLFGCLYVIALKYFSLYVLESNDSYVLENDASF